MYWHVLCLLVINASKGFNMNVTSTTQTQYTQSTNKSKESQDYVSYTPVDKTDTVDNTKESSVVDDFLIDVYSKESKNFKASVIKDEITDKVNEYASLMLQERSDESMSDQERSKLLNQFKSELLEEYKESVENSSDTTLSVQQQAVIQVLMEENTQEANALEKLLSSKGVANTDSTPTTTIAEDIDSVYTKLFTEDELSYYDKYKDTFYPMPSSFSQEIEDLQTKIIRERYPDFLPMDEALEKFGFRAHPNNPETEDDKAIREEANRQTIEEQGGAEASKERSAFIRGVFMKYPNNFADKFHDIPNAKERANVFNAGVYESLEGGDMLGNAIGKANSIISFYLNNNVQWTQQLQGSYDFFIGGDKEFSTPDIEDRNNEEIIYDGYTLDLRKYGFDRDIGTRRIYDDNEKMVTSIQNQLDYANFLIDNPEIVQKEFDKIVKKTLEESGYDYTQDHNIYQDYINPSKGIIEHAELALTIFSKYKIFD